MVLCDRNEIGMQAFLNAYYESSNSWDAPDSLKAGRELKVYAHERLCLDSLEYRAGAIQGGLNLEFQNVQEYSGIGILSGNAPASFYLIGWLP